MSAEKKAAARGRLEADAVEILTRKTRELEDECERLRTECERAAGSFKLAWQAERTAHQRDLEGAAAAKALADDAQRRLNSELSAALETQQSEMQTRDAQIDELRTANAAGARKLAAERAEAQGQLRSLHRQLARVRADKGALCEEFTSKLLALSTSSNSSNSSGGLDAPMAHANSPPLLLTGASCAPAAPGMGHGSVGGGAMVTTPSAAPLAGYEALSAFNGMQSRRISPSPPYLPISSMAVHGRPCPCTAFHALPFHDLP